MSLHFYSEKEDDEKQESMNNYLNLFIEYINNPPNLSDALKQMFINNGSTEEKSKELIEDIFKNTQELIEKNLEEIKKKYPNITNEDMQIISSYTCEAKDKNFSPYKLLNKNLVAENRKQGIKNISKYLFILLKSLRKLERYYPNEKSKYLYRSIGTKVNINEDRFNPKLVPYIEGNTKTFWGFTSTSPNARTTYDFLNKQQNNKSGTVFTLTGEIWGYDITLLNCFYEDEILMEPERKIKVDEVLPPLNEIIHVRCEVQDSPLVLKDILKSNYMKISEENSSNNHNEIEKRKDFIKSVFEGIGEKSSGDIEEDWDTLINYIPKYCIIRGCSGKFITIQFKKGNDFIKLTVPEDAKLKDVFNEYIKEQNLNDVNNYYFLCNGEKLENNSEKKLMEKNIKEKSVITVVEI